MQLNHKMLQETEGSLSLCYPLFLSRLNFGDINSLPQHKHCININANASIKGAVGIYLEAKGDG